jgi:hypothetical protein
MRSNKKYHASYYPACIYPTSSTFTVFHLGRCQNPLDFLAPHLLYRNLESSISKSKLIFKFTPWGMDSLGFGKDLGTSRYSSGRIGRTDISIGMVLELHRMNQGYRKFWIWFPISKAMLSCFHSVSCYKQFSH